MKNMELQEALKFLAQSNDELVRYLPEYDEDLHYRRVDEEGYQQDVQIPSKAAALICFTAIRYRFSAADSEELTYLLGEVVSLLAIMFDLSRDTNYHWFVNKNEHGVHGPYDHCWAILRRLASQGLSMIVAGMGPPSLPFAELIKTGGFSKGKVAWTSRD
jgi:hypothetical protein